MGLIGWLDRVTDFLAEAGDSKIEARPAYPTPTPYERPIAPTDPVFSRPITGLLLFMILFFDANYCRYGNV
jgi:hypothetical protein